MVECLGSVTGIATVVTAICIVARRLRFPDGPVAIRMRSKIDTISGRCRVLTSDFIASVHFVIAVSLLVFVHIKIRHNHSKYRSMGSS